MKGSAKPSPRPGAEVAGSAFCGEFPTTSLINSPRRRSHRIKLCQRARNPKRGRLPWAGFPGKILIVSGSPVSFGYAENMSPKMAHTTEFPLVNRPISHPIDIIRLLSRGGLPLKMARSVVEWLATTNIKGRYYRETDSVYIEIAPGSSAETREVANGLDVDLDADGNVIGFDIDNASRIGALLRDFIASHATVEDLARAWASLDGKRSEFDNQKGLGESGGAQGHYLGYLAETEEILRRAAECARERRSASPSSPASA
jgi:uncharacterized protein YuzE